ncbi:MAG TPA: DUF302 domain-containing protein [Pseudobdellovibrionaceae bacterium]|nr:DUF302 domain-containing protein [Pseudobdellovibrionaceae bacterium]
MGSYGFSTQLKCTFSEAIERVTNELKKEGYGIITDIDVQATMKAKLNIDKKPYRILGACKPALANQAIDTESDIGLLLPCNVVVREQAPGEIVVAFMDPVAVMNLVGRPEVYQLASEVKSQLERVSAALNKETLFGK